MVSVVCVAFNSEKYIIDAIESVLNQTYKDFEIIVIDDGSTDSTISLLDRYNALQNFRLIRRAHLGNPGKLRNEAIRCAKHEIIAFIDSDDIWIESKLEKQIPFLGRYDMVCTNAERIYENNVVFDSVVSGAYDILFGKNERTEVSKYVIENLNNNLEIDLPKLLSFNYVITSSVIMTKNAIENAGYFEEDLGIRGEDYSLWLRVATLYRSIYINKPMVKYRIHESNLSLLSYKERIELLHRSLEIKSLYFNDKDKLNQQAAFEGSSKIYYELAKLTLINKDYPNSVKYWLSFMKFYDKKLSLRFVKYLIIFLYLLFCDLIVGGRYKRNN